MKVLAIACLTCCGWDGSGEAHQAAGEHAAAVPCFEDRPHRFSLISSLALDPFCLFLHVIIVLPSASASNSR